ncbi:hypothetical protein EAI_04798, partial [Harpegnathos saltator]
GSPADNVDNATLEVADEILEVNGCTLEDATHEEVIRYIHQCIKSRTICLRVRRRSANKMGEFIVFLVFISSVVSAVAFMRVYSNFKERK